VGSVVTVSASGLPTLAPNYLIVTKPDGSRVFAGDFPLQPDLDGNTASRVLVDQAGTWTFEYSGMVKSRGHYVYATVATCTDQAQ
jgi:hypothetical protein